MNGQLGVVVMATGYGDNSSVHTCARVPVALELHCVYRIIGAEGSVDHKVLSAYMRMKPDRPKAYFIISFKQLILCSTDHSSALPISIICVWS